MRVPAAAAAVPLLAGSAAGIIFADSIPEHVVLACAAAALFALLAGCGFATEDLGGAVLATVFGGCLAAGLSLGGSTARALYIPPLLQWFDRDSNSDSDPVVIRGTLREDGALAEQGASLTIDVASVSRLDGAAANAHGGVRLFIAGNVPALDLSAWRAGRRVRVPALLRRPAPFRDPGVDDDTRALARRGIVLTGTIKSAALVEVIADGSVLEETAAAIRARVRRVLSAQVGGYGVRSAGIATAILIGDRTGLSEEDQRRLRDAGTYHVIAISGGNIAIFTALLLGAARLVRLPHRVAALIAIATLLLYGEVAGGAASVGRAVTAAVIFLSALVVDHRGSPLNTVAVAALLGVAIVPAAVLDAGFLLSFGATAGIIVGVPRLVQRSPPAGGPVFRRLGRPLALAAWTLLAATICAEIVLVPVAALLFSRISGAGLVLNFAAIPLMTVVQVASMAIVTFGSETAGWTRPAALVVHRAATGLVESARLVDFLPWLARDVPAPAWWLCGAYYLAAAGLLWRRTFRPSASALAVCAALIVIGPPITSRGLVPPPPAGTLRVVVLDVGQGDATAAILPDGTAILVDAGGLAGTSFDIAGRVVVPALRALGVRAVHALVITHADPDHAGGAEGVLERLGPRSIWEGVPVPRCVHWRHSVCARPCIARSGGPCARVIPTAPREWRSASCILRHPIGSGSASAMTTPSSSNCDMATSPSSCPATSVRSWSGPWRRPSTSGRW
jgi:competence protein ComEC